jgi:DNA polymerase sigma
LPPTSATPWLQVDITLNNRLAVANTSMLRDYAAIDPRLRQLVMLIKHWAKRRRVNDAYTGTLSSYAYCLLAIAHLQTRDPPVLPVLQELEPTKRQTISAWAAARGRGRGRDVEALGVLHPLIPYPLSPAHPRSAASIPQTPDGWCCDYCDDVPGLRGFGAANRESLAELLAAFFFHWAVDHDYRNAVVTIRRAAPLTKGEKGWCGARGAAGKGGLEGGALGGRPRHAAHCE